MKRPVLVLLLGLTGAASLPHGYGASPDPERTRTLLAVVNSDAALADRARALQQLSLVATVDAVPGVARLLGDEKLGQYARDVLENLPAPEAAAALREALGALQGKALIGVVGSLGVKRDERSVDALTHLATQAGNPAAPAALVSLGKIGTSPAAAVVEQALSGPPSLREAAAEGLLRAADRALAEGRPAMARAWYERVRQADLPASWKLTATRGLLGCGGAEARALLNALLRSTEIDERDLALGTAREMAGPEITADLIRDLESFPPALQAQLVSVLMDRGGDGVLPLIERKAESGPAEVRLAALRALGRVGRSSSLSILLRTAAAADGGVLTDAALAGLARIDVAETAQQVLAALSGAAPAARVRLIAVLGERKAEGATPDLMRLADDSDPAVAQAAWRALGLVARPADLPELIRRASEVQDEAMRTLADRAIVTTSMKILEPGQRSAAVLDAFRRASDPRVKAALLRPLGAIMRTLGPSHEAFFTVRAALTDPAEAVRDAATRCLADWPDAAPATTLLELALRRDTPAARREVAWRGAVRQASNVAAGRERSTLNALNLLARANGAVRSRDEKLMMVSALGNVRRIEAVGLLRPYLDDSEVQAEAGLALVQLAQALGGAREPGELRQLLEKVAATEKDEEMRRKAGRLAKGVSPPPGKTKAAPPVSGSAPAVFNGSDLSGWDGDPGVWRVRDGAIVGGTMLGNPRNEFLSYARSLRNFVLTLDYRLVGTEGFVNGGVQFRSVRIVQPPNEMSGYQADIGAGHSGCLYDESRRKKFLARATDEQIKRLEKPGEWNRYEIRCEGRQVEIKLNGETTVSYVEDDAAVADTGLIALQIHGNCKAEIAFRNLSLKELP